MKTPINYILILLLLFANTSLAERDPFNITAPARIETINFIQALIPLHYAKAKDVEKLINAKKSEFFSSRGIIRADSRTNSLWLQDNPSVLKKIQAFVKKIDIPLPEIQIEARIVNIDKDCTYELGVEFKSSKLNMDSPLGSTGTGHFNFAILKLTNNAVLDMELAALESTGEAQIISRPKLITLDRQPAYIDSGANIPYQERTAEGNTNISFKKAVLSLQVTPEVATGQKIFILHSR